MKLSTRLSVFFLGMLALVLIGFSVTIYYVARNDLYSKVNEEVDGLLYLLSAAAEVEKNSVEWKPEERDESLDVLLKKEGVQWLVTDSGGASPENWPQGDRSVVLTRVRQQIDRETLDFDTITQQVDEEGGVWRVSTHRIVSSEGDFVLDDTKVYDNGETYQFDELVVTASISLDEAHATLSGLLWWLTGTSLTIWLAAAIVGRWLSRRALWPVTEMATAAREMGATDFSRRLPVSHTGDEVEDLGAAFNDLLLRLQDSYERQRGFTGEASHQLRTPLTAILGQLEVALRRERNAGEYREVLESVQRQSGNLHKIVESLLFLARADGKSQLDRLEQVDLGEWAEQLVEEQDAEGHGPVRFERRTEGPFVADVQSVLLSQLVNNLIDNAQRYGTQDQPVTLALSRQNGVLSLSVEDQGPGIAEDDLPHVFEPFYRAAEVRRAGQAGHGLGLAVARRIATAHGGTLEAESTLGQGSRFVLGLPVAE